MPNLEWEVPHSIVSPLGTLDLNVAEAMTGRKYLILPDYKIVPSMRVTHEDLSQLDGSVPHPRFRSGLVASLKIKYVIATDPDSAGYEPACGTDLREMHELLIEHLNAMFESTATGDDQRLLWTPSGYGDQRLLNNALVLGWPDPATDTADNAKFVTFSLESPFPYAIDLTPLTIPAFTGTATITMDGNAKFLPVVEVTGPTGFLTITNTSVLDDDGNPFTFVYDSSLPGASVVPLTGAEISFFRGTMFAGTSGADLTAGIDPNLSDFFPLVPGANVIVVAGTTATFKANNAWS